MLELLFTSFPAVIRYYQLRRRGEPMTVSNMKTAVFLWLLMAFFLFLAIFYYHPKSYSGIVPFRTVSVVAQAGGPVTRILVRNGQQVKAGDLLFEIENSTQQAALKQASTEIESIDAQEAKAKSAVEVAQANVEAVDAQIKQLTVDLASAEELLRKGAGTADAVRKLSTSLDTAKFSLDAGQAQVKQAQTELTDVLPAARKTAEAAVEAAKVQLERTRVTAFSDGTVTQLLLSVGSPASQFVRNPAMVIVPDRTADTPKRVVAGFSQVAFDVLHTGMPAEIACDSNSNIGMKNAVIAARVADIQPAIAAGQVTPEATLVDPESRIVRGSVLVSFEIEHAEQRDMLLDGTGCLVQTYTNNMHGTFGHIIAATGAIKAFLLRTKVWGVLVAGVGLGGGDH